MRRSQAYMLAGIPETGRDAFLDALARRQTLARSWSVFMERHPLVLMPVSWQPPAPQDEDIASAQRAEALIAAQSPLLATAMQGMPGLSVPTGVANGLPMGVQLMSWRWREDLLLQAGAVIEQAAGFTALPEQPLFQHH